jgi:hypothetical protein
MLILLEVMDASSTWKAAQAKSRDTRAILGSSYAGDLLTCGIGCDWSLAYISVFFHEKPELLESTFSLPQISAGNLHTCGMNTNGTLLCWGYNYSGQTTAPAEPSFRSAQAFFILVE